MIVRGGRLDSAKNSEYIGRDSGLNNFAEAVPMADERQKKLAAKPVQSECEGTGAAQRAQKKNQNS